MTPTAGPDHPTWKHGRYSIAIPKGLKPILEQAAADPDLMNLRQEIALIQTAVVDSVAALETVTGVQVSSLLNAARKVRETKGQDGHEAALESLLELCERAGESADKWDAVADLTERKARLVLAEHKRAAELEQMIPANRLFALIEYIMQVIRETVKDRDVVIAIGNRLRTVLDAPTGRGAESGRVAAG